MLPHRAVLPIVTLLLSTSTAVAQPKDRLGDPLPAGAIARIGTTRLQLDREILASAVSPDGKRIAAISDSMLGVWDVPSGKQVLNLPWPRGDGSGPRVIVFTADGKSLVCNQPNEQTLCLLDIATGKVGRTLGRNVDFCYLPRDGRMALNVAWTGDAQLAVERLDLPDGRLRQRWDFAPDPDVWRTESPSYRLDFYPSADGGLIAVHERHFGLKKQLVRLHDAVTGGEIQRWPLAWPLVRELAFSDDGKRLAVLSDAAAGAATARVWDIATSKELSRWTVKGGLSTGMAALAFAPDGGSLFITESGGIVRCDWRNGKRLQDYPEAGGPIAFLDGGKTLAVQGPIGAIRLLDAATGKDLCPLPRAGDHVAIAPDSRYIAWSESGALVLADGTGKELHRWPGHERFVGPLAFAPDGKTLASAGTDLRIHLWDVPDGREQRTLIRTGVNRLFFSPDSRRLVTSGGWDVCLWDVASGKRLNFWYGRGEPPIMAPGLDVLAVPDRQARRVRLVEPTSGKELHTMAGYHGVVTYMQNRQAAFAPLFSPDSRLLVVGTGSGDPDYDQLVAWDAAGQHSRCVLHGERMMLNHVAFSPDSRLLAAMRSDGRLVLLNTANGATARLLGVSAEPLATPPVFTPDGRTLVTAIKDRVHIWEVASGGEIVRRTGHQDVVRELTLSADGRLLASASADRTALVWDLAHLAPGGAAPPETLWADLASPEAPRGRRAVEALIATPAQAVALLQKRLPVAAPDPGKLARWLAELGSDDFDQRQEAEHALDGVGELAEAALRKALAAKPPAEARRRIENLLKKLDAPVLSAAQLRAVRGVQVLEALASAEARRLLDALAKGPAAARQTSEARAALERLAK